MTNMLLPMRHERSALLMGWTLPLGIWFHRVGPVPAPLWRDIVDGFFRHVAMAGGLLDIVVFGAGICDAG